MSLALINVGDQVQTKANAMLTVMPHSVCVGISIERAWGEGADVKFPHLYLNWTNSIFLVLKVFDELPTIYILFSI